MKKQFFPYTSFNRFRAYSKFNLDDTFQWGIQVKINLLFINKWVTIFKKDDYTMPYIKIGCINYPFTKIVELLNNL